MNYYHMRIISEKTVTLVCIKTIHSVALKGRRLYVNRGGSVPGPFKQTHSVQYMWLPVALGSWAVTALLKMHFGADALNRQERPLLGRALCHSSTHTSLLGLGEHGL